jgi:WXG100 family type VII secretion target
MVRGTFLKGIRMINVGQQGGGSWEGMNPDVVEAQARILSGLSGEITTLMQKIEGEVTALADAWHGDDSRRFAAEWAGTHKPVFTTAAALLADMGDTSARSAAAQRTTSSN